MKKKRANILFQAHASLTEPERIAVVTHNRANIKTTVLFWMFLFASSYAVHCRLSAEGWREPPQPKTWKNHQSKIITSIQMWTS